MELIYKATFDALPIGAMIIRRDDPETFMIIDVNNVSSIVGG